MKQQVSIVQHVRLCLRG